MKNNGRLWVGAIFVAIGFIFLIDQLGFLTPFGIGIGWFFSLLWPALILSLGIYLIYRRSFIFGIILSFLGIGFVISTLTDWSFWGAFWPLIIIGVGLSILFRTKDEKKTPKGGIKTEEKLSNVQTDTIDNIDEVAILSGKEKHINSTNFTGGKATSVFGGMKLDLRDIKLSNNGAILDAASIFGSLKIYVPKNIRVESSGTPILGSWENKFETDSKSKAKVKVLKITGAAIFGSVEIIN